LQVLSRTRRRPLRVCVSLFLLELWSGED